MPAVKPPPVMHAPSPLRVTPPPSHIQHVSGPFLVLLSTRTTFKGISSSSRCSHQAIVKIVGMVCPGAIKLSSLHGVKLASSSKAVAEPSNDVKLSVCQVLAVFKFIGRYASACPIFARIWLWPRLRVLVSTFLNRFLYFDISLQFTRRGSTWDAFKCKCWSSLALSLVLVATAESYERLRESWHFFLMECGRTRAGVDGSWMSRTQDSIMRRRRSSARPRTRKMRLLELPTLESRPGTVANPNGRTAYSGTGARDRRTRRTAERGAGTMPRACAKGNGSAFALRDEHDDSIEIVGKGLPADLAEAFAPGILAARRERWGANGRMRTGHGRGGERGREGVSIEADAQLKREEPEQRLERAPIRITAGLGVGAGSE
ncbi:hypothetical protein C8R45DRAFT_1076785 [Mycena sanguinolenta]|nr:hypothetical protein C8R45DRAFT_1076785 [Mycena sanguinolenta]